MPTFLENLTDEELKKEAKNESKNDTISAIVKSLKNLASLVPGMEEKVKTLEMFRLKMLLRQLQISSFSGHPTSLTSLTSPTFAPTFPCPASSTPTTGKMSALNEVNKVIAGVIYTTTPQARHTSQSPEDEDFLTADRSAPAAVPTLLLLLLIV